MIVQVLASLRISPNVDRVVPRRDIETGQVGLFFWEGGKGRRELTCYFHVGQHSPASLGYYHQKTEPVDPTNPEVVSLAKEWGSQPPMNNVRLMKRLVMWSKQK